MPARPATTASARSCDDRDRTRVRLRSRYGGQAAGGRGGQPRRPVAEAFGHLRRRLPFGRRRVTDGAVRLPTIMTFVVAMFAATMALVSFGYVATREWRSGTNLLARAARQRGAGAGARGAQRRHEGRLDHRDRAVQHDGAGRGAAVRPLQGGRPRVRPLPVPGVVRPVEARRTG